MYIRDQNKKNKKKKLEKENCTEIIFQNWSWNSPGPALEQVTSHFD